MRTLSSCLVPLSLAALLLVAACGQEPSAPVDRSAGLAVGDTLTVFGTLIDARCFQLDKDLNRADDHVRPEGPITACASACARQGWPVAVLEAGTPDGYVWMLSFPAPVFADYMARPVRVLGQFRSEGILVPQRVEVQSGEAWTVIL